MTNTPMSTEKRVEPMKINEINPGGFWRKMDEIITDGFWRQVDDINPDGFWRKVNERKWDT